MDRFLASNRRLGLYATTFAIVTFFVISRMVVATAQTSAPPAADASAAPLCPAQPEMSFAVSTSTLQQTFGEGLRDYIYADGVFCRNTDQKFEQFLAQNPPKGQVTIVVFNSGGGNLAAAVRMGRIIRMHKMWTEVGSQLPLMIPQNENLPAHVVPFIGEPAAPPFPGECASACTLAFMGGVHRTVGYASNYGVHQFETPAQMQTADLQMQTEQASAKIIGYLDEMGVSANYMLLMAQKTGNAITNLTMKQLQVLNIVTPHWQTKWQITPRADNSGFYLDGVTVDRWGTHDIAIACGPKAASPAPPAPSSTVALLATFALDPGRRANASDLVGAVDGYVLELSGRFAPSFTPAKTPIAVVGNRLTATLGLTQALAESLPHVPNIGLAFLFKEGANPPVRLMKFEADLDGALIEKFAATCR